MPSAAPDCSPFPDTIRHGTMDAMHRIGLLVPSSNTTMETEVPALLRARERMRPADTFSFHSARLRMENVTPEALRAMNEQTERATAELADLRPSVVATACLVAIMAQGPNSHAAAEAEIAAILERERAPAPVVSSAGALVDALHALGARRIGIVAPYLEELMRLVVEYIEDAGIEVGDAISLEVSDNRAVAALDPSDLADHWRRLDLRRCDALVLSACVQMRSLPAIAEVERRSGLPTLSAAMATTWAILRALDLEPVAPNAGALLRPAPERVA
jgi:maleate isomerase